MHWNFVLRGWSILTVSIGHRQKVLCEAKDPSFSTDTDVNGSWLIYEETLPWKLSLRSLVSYCLILNPGSDPFQLGHLRHHSFNVAKSQFT